MDTPPPSTRLTPGDVFGVGLDAGLHGKGSFEGRLVLEDVTLEALGRALGPALVANLTREAAFAARNVTVLGYENGLIIGGPLPTATLEDVAVDCRGPAFYETDVGARAVHVPGRGPVLMDRVHVQNCGWPEDRNPQCGEPCASAARAWGGPTPLRRWCSATSP